MSERGRLSGAVSHLAHQRQGLLVEFQRPLGLTGGMVHPCHVVERGRFSGAVSHLTRERQGLLVEFQRPLGLTRSTVHPCHVVPGLEHQALILAFREFQGSFGVGQPALANAQALQALQPESRR